MPVSHRIKILKCCSFEEAEQKVNDFLAFDENIGHLVGIDYRLEFNIVIIEYIVRMNNNNNNIKNNNNNNNLFTYWWEFYFPALFYGS